VRYRLDLADEWKSRRWRRLLNMIDQLPRDSFMQEAMADDEALAEHMLAQAPSERPPARRWSEYGIQVELLAGIYDRLAEVPNAIAAANGAKPRKVKPYPRPVTAIERVRERRARQKHRSIVARLLPNGADESAFLRSGNDAGPAALPAHGLRSPSQPGRPIFPTSD
jgi:hypothetical protein